MKRSVGIAIATVLMLPAMAVAKGSNKTFIAETIDLASIYAAPSSKARKLYNAPKKQLLYVTPYSDRYLQVLMSKNVTGYIRFDKVRIGQEADPYKVKESKVATNSSRSSTAGRANAAEKGLNYIGTPYVWGGNDIKNGIDCSAFVKQLYGDIGMSLPRTAAEQAQVGQPITRLEQLQKGDRLYFWEKKRNKIGHTGIYLGNGYFVHSSRGHNGVNTDYLSDKWLKILVAARR
jgi:cell wall-associated NlpC family hydrolase